MYEYLPVASVNLIKIWDFGIGSAAAIHCPAYLDITCPLQRQWKKDLLVADITLSRSGYCELHIAAEKHQDKYVIVIQRRALYEILQVSSIGSTLHS